MAASAVGANPEVRAFLLGMQRDMAKTQDVLMDGRDIGTVVLPDATVKIFLTASPEARATRRWKEYQQKGVEVSYEEVLADVRQRDYQDTHRCRSPPPTGRRCPASGHLGDELRAESGGHEEDDRGESRMILYYIIVPLAWLVFNIGFRVRCEGRENLKKVGTKGCIIAPNHISAIDPVFIVITRFWGQRMMVFAKKELFEINPFLSWFFRCAGASASGARRRRSAPSTTR